jgi:uncharacterized protein (DUF1697 family)
LPASRCRYVALLRGVNVGKAARVPMAGLRELLAGLGYAEVATLLNSGNAVFAAGRARSAVLASEIAAALVRDMNVTVPVIVKSAGEFDAIVRENPFTAASIDPSRLLVGFTQDARSLATLAAINDATDGPDEFHLGRHAAFLHCRARLIASRAAQALLGKAGKVATTRNWSTTLKLHTLVKS